MTTRNIYGFLAIFIAACLLLQLACSRRGHRVDNDAFFGPNRSQPLLSTRPTLYSYKLCAVITRTAQQISFNAFWDNSEPRFSNEFGCSCVPLNTLRPTL